MNLYLISQTVNNNYDTYDSAVVVAESEEVAREIHPGGDVLDKDGLNRYGNEPYDWCAKKDVDVTLIGTASEEILSVLMSADNGRNGKSTDGVSGIICASFNAG